MKRYFLVFAFIAIGLFNLPAQDLPEVTNKYLIQNAIIVTSPGVELNNASLLIHDGIIAAVGTELTAPPDAEVIRADSMYVYAGFILPASHIGIPKPKEDNQPPRVERRGYPPNDVAGILPDRTVDSHYNPKDNDISAFRKEGFAMAHTFPRGLMLPGQGAVISLNSKAFSEAVVQKQSALFAQFTGARRMFPATTIGVMAKWRELYKQSELMLNHEKAFKENPRHKKRPNADAAEAALYPVIQGSMPVFFRSPGILDVYRANKLQADLGFKLVLAEVEKGDMAIDLIKSTGYPVLLSLNLPKEEKEDKKNEKKDESTESEEKKKKEVDEQLEALKQRKKESIENYHAQAALFAEADIPFSFSYMEVKAKDVHANIRKMIAQGLSENDALAGLTTSAAEILGIDGIAGTLETGKIGNLVMMTQPIFDEKSKIKMVFVDGVKYEMDITEKKTTEAKEDVARNLIGTWSYEIDVPGMTPSGTMTFTDEGESFTIVLTNNQMPGESITVEEVELDGSSMSFEYSVDAGGMNITVNSEITFDGNNFEGEVIIADFGNFPIKGEKLENPEK